MSFKIADILYLSISIPKPYLFIYSSLINIIYNWKKKKHKYVTNILFDKNNSNLCVRKFLLKNIFIKNQ